MNFLWIALTGFLGGLAGGLFGVGGGLIFVPLLILFGRFDPHLAIGTSMMVIVPTAAVAAWKHSQHGMIHWPTVAMILVFCILGAWLGATLSIKMNALVLRKVFAVFLMLVAARLFFQNG